VSFHPFESDFGELQDWSRTDYVLGLPDDERLTRFAKAIEASHKDQADATRSWRTLDNRVLGLKGERAFARVFGLRMDLKIKKFGNRRINFELRDGAKVDVVTRSLGLSGQYPELTIRHRANSRSKLVLYLIIWGSEHNEPMHAGWITEQEAHRTGRVETFKSGIVNTVVSMGQLNDPIKLLRAHNPDSQWLETQR
jgi:hypothetical protein